MAAVGAVKANRMVRLWRRESRTTTLQSNRWGDLRCADAMMCCECLNVVAKSLESQCRIDRELCLLSSLAPTAMELTRGKGLRVPECQH